MTQNYKPQQVTGTWLEITNLLDGIAEGTFVTASRTSRSKSLNEGGDGGTTVVHSASRSGIVTVTYRMGAPILSRLTTLVLNDEDRSDSLVQTGPIFFKDNSGPSEISAETATIDGVSDAEFATDEGDTTVTWLCTGLRIEVRGSGGLLAAAAPPL